MAGKQKTSLPPSPASAADPEADFDFAANLAESEQMAEQARQQWKQGHASGREENTPQQDSVTKRDKNAGLSRSIVFKTAQEILSEPRPAWIIPRLIQEHTLNLIVAEPKTFKTFLALDMAARLHKDSQDTQWQGMNTRKFDAVCYLYLEGHPSSRIKAWEAHNARPFPNVQIYNGSFHMVEDYQALRDAIPDGALLFIDTLSASISGMDENSAKDMSMITANLYKLIHDKKATVVVIHHMGKDSAKGARGSSVFLGNVDSQIHIKKVGEDKIKVWAKVIREEKDGEEWMFQRIIYDVGIDDDGNPITSCALKHLIGEAVADTGKRQFFNMNTQPRQNAIKSLKEALKANDGHPVTDDEWRPYFYSGSVTKDGLNEEEKTEAKRQAFYRVRQELVCHGIIELIGEKYRFPKA